jgi:hypothetical protein
MGGSVSAIELDAFLKTLGAIAIFLALTTCLTADTLARPLVRLIPIGLRRAAAPVIELRDKWFYLFRVRGGRKTNATQALVFAGLLWVWLRILSNVGPHFLFWIGSVVLLAVLFWMLAMVTAGPNVMRLRLASIFFMPAVLLVGFPFAVKRAERIVDNTIVYMSKTLAPAVAQAERLMRNGD